MQQHLELFGEDLVLGNLCTENDTVAEHYEAELAWRLRSKIGPAKTACVGVEALIVLECAQAAVVIGAQHVAGRVVQLVEVCLHGALLRQEQDRGTQPHVGTRRNAGYRSSFSS